MKTSKPSESQMAFVLKPSEDGIAIGNLHLL